MTQTPVPEHGTFTHSPVGTHSLAKRVVSLDRLNLRPRGIAVKNQQNCHVVGPLSVPWGLGRAARIHGGVGKLGGVGSLEEMGSGRGPTADAWEG
jgi:hypothetical protein